jgi:hypothetical protein
MRKLKTERMYFAYDTPDDLEPLIEAGKMLRASGITAASHTAANRYSAISTEKPRE